VLIIGVLDQQLVFQQRNTVQWQLGTPRTLFFVTIFSLSYAMFVGCAQIMVLQVWIARHFETIQAIYPPWPKDKPFSKLVTVHTESPRVSLIPAGFILMGFLMLDLVPTLHERFAGRVRLFVSILSVIGLVIAWQRQRLGLWFFFGVALLVFSPFIFVSWDPAIRTVLNIVFAFALPTAFWLLERKTVPGSRGH